MYQIAVTMTSEMNVGLTARAVGRRIFGLSGFRVFAAVSGRGFASRRVFATSRTRRQGRRTETEAKSRKRRRSRQPKTRNAGAGGAADAAREGAARLNASRYGRGGWRGCGRLGGGCLVWPKGDAGGVGPTTRRPVKGQRRRLERGEGRARREKDAREGGGVADAAPWGAGVSGFRLKGSGRPAVAGRPVCGADASWMRPYRRTRPEGRIPCASRSARRAW